MKPLRIPATALALLFAVPALFASPPEAIQRGGITRKGIAATSYSVEVPVVTRVQGTAFFRTAIDISNNTITDGVTATFQYSYTRTSDNAFFRTNPQTLTLLAIDNFHQDDIVQYLGSLGLLEPGAADSSFGTLLVTFESLPSSAGWEGTVVARTYSPNPTGAGTLAIAYPASLFFESASSTLVTTIRDTRAAPTFAGQLRTNVGIRSTDINGSNENVTVTLEFYDVTPGSPTNGERVGNIVTVSGIRPGELRLVNNVFSFASIPAGIDSLILFADVQNPTLTSPTIEGYVSILDGGTQDGAFFEMKCADLDGCAN